MCTCTHFYFRTLFFYFYFSLNSVIPLLQYVSSSRLVNHHHHPHHPHLGSFNINSDEFKYNMYVYMCVFFFALKLIEIVFSPLTHIERERDNGTHAIYHIMQ